MTDEDRDELLNQIFMRIDAIPKSCGGDFSGDIILSHSKILTELRQNVKYLNEKLSIIEEKFDSKLERIDKKFDTLFKKYDDHSSRITVIETEKRTWIAIFLSVGAITWDFVKDFFHRFN
ncbi:MAG: hypothetical protein A2017_20865 [Lentisphaerae bacterium GWF2_44_16]|nr:MAG: hypothetical protein A2017_20865 [Lentisphaerae bacterium GWF2_44_16]